MFFQKSLAAIVAAGSIVALSACSGTSTNAPPLGRIASTQGRAIQSVPGRPDLFIGVNDVPRRGSSARFQERRAAAHARGRWLTDELNLLRDVRPLPNGAAILAGINGHDSSSTTQRSTRVIRNACDTCDPGGGGSSTGTVTTFDDNGGYGPYDTEIDFTDGTSLLTKEWVGAYDGTQVLTFIDERGQYSMAVGMTNGSGGNGATPAPRPTATPGTEYCYPMDGGYISCGGQPMNPIPKWACPYLGGGAGLAAKWAVTARAGGKAGDAAGLAVGASLIKLCNDTGL